jgi:hypothetical protein
MRVRSFRRVELRESPVVEDIEGPAVNRRSIPASTRSFIAAISAVWADCDNASRRLVERQMGPRHPRHG